MSKIEGRNLKKKKKILREVWGNPFDSFDGMEQAE